MKEITDLKSIDLSKVTYKDKLKFDFYGYSSANDGKYYINNEEFFSGTNNMNPEQYKQYKDLGMTIFFPQTVLDTFDEESYAKLKEVLEEYKKVGIKKTIIFDHRISHLSLSKEEIIGEGKQFKNEEELDNYMEECISLYAEDPLVYGVMLGDEPRYYQLETYTAVYRSLKRVIKKNNYQLFVQFNLNPFCDYREGMFMYAAPVEDMSGTEHEVHVRMYENYIRSFLDKMNPECIQYDAYPFRKDFMNKSFIPGLEIVCKEAARRGIDVYFVSQTFGMFNNGNRTYRKVGYKELNWLNNIELGFGIKQISYFTYYTKAVNMTHGELFPDQEAMVNRDGTPTETYKGLKKCLKYNQKFAPIILNFTYNTRQLYTMYPMDYDTFHIQFVEKDGKLAKIDEFRTDKGCVYVTELVDKKRDNYMYMLMNVIDPRITGDKTVENITVKFNDEYKYVMVFSEGVIKYYELENGIYETTLKPGYADFVIPF